MITLNRRQMVLGVGAMAGLGRTATASVLDLSNDHSLTPTEILKGIHLSGDAEARFLQRLGTGSSPHATLSAGAPNRRGHRVEAEAMAQTGANGTVIARALAFMCDSSRRNHLYVGGRPFVARRFSFSTPQIAWSPGLGLPFYDSYAPRFDYATSAYYPAAKWHQIVPTVGNEVYFTGCNGSDVCEVAQAGPVSFDVNDSDYDDNAGSYLVAIWSWS